MITIKNEVKNTYLQLMYSYGAFDIIIVEIFVKASKVGRKASKHKINIRLCTSWWCQSIPKATLIPDVRFPFAR